MKKETKTEWCPTCGADLPPNHPLKNKKQVKGCVVWGLVFKGDENDTDPIHFYNGVCVYPSRRMALEDINNWGGKKSVKVVKFCITSLK